MSTTDKIGLQYELLEQTLRSVSELRLESVEGGGGPLGCWAASRLASGAPGGKRFTTGVLLDLSRSFWDWRPFASPVQGGMGASDPLDIFISLGTGSYDLRRGS